MNDKKKMIIIGVLGAVLLAVGAFQFMGPSTPATVVEPEAEAKAEAAPVASAAPVAEPEDPIRKELIGIITGAATPRDPFRAGGALATEFANSPTKTPPLSEAPTSGNPPPPKPVQSNPIVPPMDPIQGSFPSQGPVAVSPDSTNPVLPTEPSKNTDGFGYKVRGVIVGKSRLVVLEDSDGNQKLVPEGGSVDGDTTIVGVREGSVEVRIRGQKQRVQLEEDRR